MTFRSRQPLLAGAVLAAALAVEFADELVDGTQGAALPLIRHDLALSYGQIGLLASVPLLLGSLLELPVGVLAGHGRRRRVPALAGFATLAWLGIARHGPRAPAAADHPGEPGEPGEQGDPGEPGGAGALRRLRGALRQAGVVRWLVLLEVADLLLDVLTGFLAIYLVDVVHATPAQAALAVTVRLVA